jgi:hypothetical protein
MPAILILDFRAWRRPTANAKRGNTAHSKGFARFGRGVKVAKRLECGAFLWAAPVSYGRVESGRVALEQGSLQGKHFSVIESLLVQETAQ